MNALITGGAGFIGTNLAAALLKRGDRVTIFDNFSRRGTEANGDWLTEQSAGDQLTIVRGDIRTDQALLERSLAGIDAVYHLAGQVAVTTSVTDPREDFEINALGTFNMLEAVRSAASRAALLYASTNKVYGGMETITINKTADRYRYADFPQGIPETQLLDFHSPYGCSKGAADQYVRDYARIYGLNTVVFRQSCIYGPRQFGIEDQGWVAWFTIAALFGQPITIYGDGKQVRDVLFVDDLVAAYLAATDKIAVTAGKIYNIGGGPANTLSLRELVATLDAALGAKLKPKRADWRPGDQPVYISDIRLAKTEFGWAPTVSTEEGVHRLIEWVRVNRPLFAAVGLIPSETAARP